MTTFDQFLSELRSATQATHTALEELPLSRVMMAGTLTPEAYVRYLQAAHVMHSAVETIVFKRVEQVIADTEDRRKLSLLESDLQALGAEPATADAAFLDAGYEDSVPFSLGMVYAIEGSSLGGRFLLKNIRKTLGETAPAAYFDAYGERTGSLWKGFLQQLAAYCDRADDDERAAILRGAVYGFDRTAALFAQFSEAVVSEG